MDVQTGSKVRIELDSHPQANPPILVAVFNLRLRLDLGLGPVASGIRSNLLIKVVFSSRDSIGLRALETSFVAFSLNC